LIKYISEKNSNIKKQ